MKLIQRQGYTQYIAGHLTIDILNYVFFTLSENSQMSSEFKKCWIKTGLKFQQLVETMHYCLLKYLYSSFLFSQLEANVLHKGYLTSNFLMLVISNKVVLAQCLFVQQSLKVTTVLNEWQLWLILDIMAIAAIPMISRLKFRCLAGIHLYSHNVCFNSPF